MPSTSTSTSVVDELRQLFARDEYDALLSRTENLHKRKRRDDDDKTKQLVQLVRAQALIHVSRPSEALALLTTLPPTVHPSITSAAQFARLYIAWACNDGVEDAVKTTAALTGDDARRLHAQLLYRCGRYAEAAEISCACLRAAQATLAEKKRPATVSRWRLVSREPAPQPVTATELLRYATLVAELATNAQAALVLADRPSDAISLAADLPRQYELEYNSACAHISQKNYELADACLQRAEMLVRASVDDDEEDVEEMLGPVMVQKAFLEHLNGNVADAEKSYAAIVADRKVDAASLAVAANNLTVALGQLSFGRTDKSASDSAQQLSKEQHDALVEGLKKMRATSGKVVERKLTTHQRRAMARNRAILLVQMGRMDACRAELSRMKSEFPRDPVVPLIEASLVARQSGLETADRILEMSGDDLAVRAARVQLAVAHGDGSRAADLLQQFFAGKPAAIATAACLLEQSGAIDNAITLLNTLIADSATAPQQDEARKLLAGVLLRTRRYDEAARVLRDVVVRNEGDGVARARLVVATSFFDAAEAERVARGLPSEGGATAVDAAALEALPPPKRKHVVAARKAGGSATATASTAAATAPAAAASAGSSASAPRSAQNGLTGDEAAAKAAAARERKKRKRKKRLPKDYDASGPPPDPERWLPKTLRAGYKKKGKKKASENHFRGSQGADAAAAEAAAVKNAERAAAKAAATKSGAANAADASAALPPTGRARVQRKKKNRR